MADRFRKVSPGDRLLIPAAAYNAFIDSTRDYLSRCQNQGQTPQRRFSSSGVVSIRNDADQAVGRFGILGISGIVIGPSDNLEDFQNQPALIGVVPYIDDHTGLFAIVLEPLAVGAIGMALVSGISVVQVDVSDANHEYADVQDEAMGFLRSTVSGIARILWRESGTGTKWAVVRVGGGVGEQLPHSTFACLVWRDGGGTDGDKTNPCNRTYTAKTLDSVTTLGTALTPKKTRPAVGKLWTPPTTGDGIVGLGYYDGTDAFCLYDANETLAPQACA